MSTTNTKPSAYCEEGFDGPDGELCGHCGKPAAPDLPFPYVRIYEAPCGDGVLVTWRGDEEWFDSIDAAREALARVRGE